MIMAKLVMFGYIINSEAKSVKLKARSAKQESS